MYQLLLTLVLICTFTTVSFAQGIHHKISVDSLLKQQQFYSIEVTKNRKSAELWRKYYEASKHYLTVVADRSIQKQQMTLDSILADMKTQIPTSFEYQLCMWRSVVLSSDRVPFFLKAKQLQPNDPTVLTEALYVALMTNNDSVITVASKEVYSKAIIPTQMMNFAYNTLISTPANALVAVDSDQLFEAMIVLQYVKNIRKEVSILNKRTLAENNNRVIIFQKNSLQAFATMYNNSEKFTSISEPFHNTIGVILKFSQKTICFASNFNAHILSAYKDSLYVIGTIYQYSGTTIENAKILLNNWTKLRLEYLRFDLYGEQYNTANSIKQETFPIYISCATILYNYSKEKEDLNAMTMYRGFALSVAKQIGAYEDVEAYFLALEKQKN